MEITTTPPPCTTETDGTSDAALLKAISQNAECAHILAEIANGGDPRQLLATLMPIEEDSTTESESAPTEETKVAMYQSPAQQSAEVHQAESCPSFLTNIRPDFWENF